MNLEKKFGLDLSCIASLRSVFEQHRKVDEVILFGSRAKGEFKNNSDIDLAIVGPKLTTTDLLKIENEIDDLLLPYKVDLVLIHQIENQDLLDHIKRVGQKFEI